MAQFNHDACGLAYVNDDTFRKCASCGESIHKLEVRLALIDEDGNRGRGDTYCKADNCASNAMDNCEESGTYSSEALLMTALAELQDDPEFDAMVAAERSQEDFAAYQAAGLTVDDYLTDRNAGYCN
jgi:hypothetical protein